MHSRTVNGITICAANAGDLEDAAKCVACGEPMLASRMRLRGAEEAGEVCYIDRQKRTVKLSGVAGDHPWEAVEYA